MSQCSTISTVHILPSGLMHAVIVTNMPKKSCSIQVLLLQQNVLPRTKTTSVCSKCIFLPRVIFAQQESLQSALKLQELFRELLIYKIYQTMSIHLDLSRLFYTSTRLLHTSIFPPKKNGNPSSHVSFKVTKIRINIPVPPTHRRHHQNPLASSNRRARDLGVGSAGKSSKNGPRLVEFLW